MQDLINLEEQGWKILSTRRDLAIEFFEELLIDEAVMVFPGGMMMRGKQNILAVIDSQPWKSFQIEEQQVISLSLNVAAIVYKVTAQREGSDSYIALISSVYTLHEGQWKLTLHQQTPV
ncbi:MAG: nuclear transport factor 2 family protein [Kastovskya adunca ATA6-11-RM4]|jgi:hypothetical protein|nr:nuclear transport factor 2 family protein [Kastovskya adunca ATA6-11-RM4]